MSCGSSLSSSCMPILLTNMLVCNNYTDLYSIIITRCCNKVGLAVGDIQAVQDEAALQKLALQVFIIN